MKLKYEKPLAKMECFVPNRTIASGCSPSSLTFSCLNGPQVDTTKVVASSEFIETTTTCGTNATYANGVTSAKKESTGRSYSASSADGLLYICVDKNGNVVDGYASAWSTSGSTLYHDKSHPSNDMYHCEVVGVNVSTVQTS